mmetsp:Transcript_33777/g.36401  ORF Transcript_33777/g.36401 Transcript_33777/m.36401 type:complete len:600 (+) Transcript_33777:434-2233(+)
MMKKKEKTEKVSEGTSVESWLISIGEKKCGSASFSTYLIKSKKALVATKENAPPPPALKRLWGDTFIMDHFQLGAVWFYDSPLNEDDIRNSIGGLLDKIPVLSGRRCSKAQNEASHPHGWVVQSNEGARFSFCNNFPGSAYDFVGSKRHVEAPKGQFVDIQDGNGIESGAEPLLTVRVTNFGDGKTSCIGISIPHSIVDGKSYFSIVSIFAAGHSLGSFDLLKAPDMDSAAVWDKAIDSWNAKKEREQVEGGKSVIKSMYVKSALFLGKKMMKSLLNKDFNKMMPRAKIHFTQAELHQLKKNVDSLSGGKKKATTNEIVSAIFLKAFAEQWGFKEAKPGYCTMVVNGQGKGLLSEVKNTCGNFSHGVTLQLEKAPQEMSLVDILSFWHEVGDTWRSKEKSALEVEKLAKLSYGDIDSDDLTPKKPNFIVNNQSCYIMAQIRFGRDATCIGYTPWHSADHIHIVAALESEASRPSIVKRYSNLKKIVGSIDTADAFDRVDTDNSGDITREELGAALANARSDTVDDREIDQMMEMIDTDSSHTIDREEFGAAFYAARLCGGFDVYVAVPKSKSNKGVSFYESNEFKQILLGMVTAELPSL